MLPVSHTVNTRELWIMQEQSNSRAGNLEYIVYINRKLSDKMHTELDATATLGDSFSVFFLFVSLFL